MVSPFIESGLRSTRAWSSASIQPGCPGVKIAWASSRRRAADQRDLGIAVEEDLLEVVVELQVLEGLRLAGQPRVPARPAHRLAHAREAGQARIVLEEV